MFIYEEDIQNILQLIDLQRNTNKTPWKDLEKIIPKSTYFRQLAGKKTKKDYITPLLEFYQFDYEHKENFTIWKETYYPKLFKALEYNQEEQFDSLIEEYKTELGPYQDKIIYQQYYQIFTYILNYYQSSIYMNKKEIEEALTLLQYMKIDNELQIYLLETMFISNNNSIYDMKLQAKVFNMINKLNHPILESSKALYYKCNSNFESALQILNENLEYFKKVNNPFRIQKLVVSQFNIYKNIDKEKALEKSKELLMYKQQKLISEKSVYLINYNIAIFYYLQKQYAESKDLFYENYQLNQRSIDMLFVCACYSRLKEKMPADLDHIQCPKDQIGTYLHYFQLKRKYERSQENIQACDLIEYILYNAMQYLVNDPYRMPLWDMFDYELCEIVTSQKNIITCILNLKIKWNKFVKTPERKHFHFFVPNEQITIFFHV